MEVSACLVIAFIAGGAVRRPEEQLDFLWDRVRLQLVHEELHPGTQPVVRFFLSNDNNALDAILQ